MCRLNYMMTTIYSLMVFSGLFYCRILSDNPNKCDMTVWHMRVMEHLLTQETEVTQRQQSTLDKVETMIQHITADGGSPLVSCTLLSTYTYNLVPEHREQLMDLTLRESHQTRGLPTRLVEAQPSRDLRSSNSEHADKSSSENERFHKETNTENIDGSIDHRELSDGTTGFNTEQDRSNRRGKNDNDPNSGDDNSLNNNDKTDNQNTESVEDEHKIDVKSDSTDSIKDNSIKADKNSGENNDEPSEKDNDSSKRSDKDSNVINDKDHRNTNKLGDVINNDDYDETNGKESNGRNQAGVNIERDENVNHGQNIVQGEDDDNHDENREEYMRSKTYNSDDIDESRLQTQDDEDAEEEEDCFYRSADEFVCTRRHRNINKGKEDRKTEREHTDNGGRKETYDDESRDDEEEMSNASDKLETFDQGSHVDTRDKFDDDVRNDEYNKESHDTLTIPDDAKTRFEPVDSGDRLKMLDKDSHEDKDEFRYETVDSGDRLQILDKDSHEDKDEFMDRGERNDRFSKEKSKKTNVDTGDDGDGADTIHRLTKESHNTQIKNDDEDKHARFRRDGSECPDTNCGVQITHSEKDKKENDDAFTDDSIEGVDEGNNDSQKGSVGSNEAKIEHKMTENQTKDSTDKSKEDSTHANGIINNGVLDKENLRSISESLKPKDESNDIKNERNDNGDGVIIFYDDENEDVNDDVNEVASKSSQESESVVQENNSLESISSRTDNHHKERNERYDSGERVMNVGVDSGHEETQEGSEFMLSPGTFRQSGYLRQHNDDNDGDKSVQRKLNEDYSENSNEGHEELLIKHSKHRNSESTVSFKEDTHQEEKSPKVKINVGITDSIDHSTLDVKKIEVILAQRETEQAAKIQNLELMLVKLENKMLTQSADKQSDKNAFINLENQILKLENELMKLSQSYRQLQEEHIALKAQQRKSFLELEHMDVSPRKSEYPALADNSTSDMLAKQNARIVELSTLVQKQSVTAQLIHARSEQLEAENRKLFQFVMNQTALMSTIMRKLEELEGAKLNTQIHDGYVKAQFENFRQTQTLQRDHKSPQQITDAFDLALGSSVKGASAIQSKDLVSVILGSRGSPTATSPSVSRDIKWQCAGQNSTRLCVFNSLIISNCTPFNDLYWAACKQQPGSWLLSFDDQKKQKLKDNVQVYLPNNDQVTQNREAQASLKSEVNEKSRNDETVVQTDNRQKTVMPLVASPSDDTKHESSRSVTNVASNGENVNMTTNDAFQSELDINSISTSKLSNMMDKDGEKIYAAPSVLNNFLEPTQKIKEDDNEDKTDQDGRQDANVHISHQNEHKGTGILGNDLKMKTTSETNNQPDSGNIGVHDALPETKTVSQSSLCEQHAKLPECSNNLAHTSKMSPQLKPVGPEISQQGGLKPLADSESDKRHQSDHSTFTNEASAAQRDAPDDSEAQLRKKAAEEARNTHEALYREILYSPIHEDRPKDCYELYKQGQKRSGLSQIYVSGINVYVTVYCDMANSGWTLLLKREDGLVDFYRNQEQYKEGFGAPRGEHYIGNDVIHHLTNQGRYSLRVELTDWAGTTRHAHYDHFWVDDEEENFRLHLSGYSGDAGDGLGKHNGMKFSTFDADHDLLKSKMGGSCAKRFHGAGWYYKCYSSNLLGRYYTGPDIPDNRFDGISWKPWHGPGYSLKTVVLAVRPFGAE